MPNILFNIVYPKKSFKKPLKWGWKPSTLSPSLRNSETMNIHVMQITQAPPTTAARARLTGGRM